jgi:hypothetical protein
MALKQFVDAWLHIANETGVYQAAFRKWLQ